jgi:hypothetical protein
MKPFKSRRFLFLFAAAFFTAALSFPSLSQASIIILNTDDRVMTNSWCEISYYIGSWHTDDWEAINWDFDRLTYLEINDTLCTCSYPSHECSGNCFYTVSATSPGRRAVILKGDGYTYQNLRMTCEFYVNGARHYDYEDLGTWNGFNDIYLELNGEGGTWNSTTQRWEGDFLHLQ